MGTHGSPASVGHLNSLSADDRVSRPRTAVRRTDRGGYFRPPRRTPLYYGICRPFQGAKAPRNGRSNTESNEVAVSGIRTAATALRPVSARAWRDLRVLCN